VRRRRLAALVPCGLLRWCPAACCAGALRPAALLPCGLLRCCVRRRSVRCEHRSATGPRIE